MAKIKARDKPTRTNTRTRTSYYHTQRSMPVRTKPRKARTLRWIVSIYSGKKRRKTQKYIWESIKDPNNYVLQEREKVYSFLDDDNYSPAGDRIPKLSKFIDLCASQKQQSDEALILSEEDSHLLNIFQRNQQISKCLSSKSKIVNSHYNQIKIETAIEILGRTGLESCQFCK